MLLLAKGQLVLLHGIRMRCIVFFAETGHYAFGKKSTEHRCRCSRQCLRSNEIKAGYEKTGRDDAEE